MISWGMVNCMVCVNFSVLFLCFPHAVHSVANARRIAIVEQCFGSTGLVSYTNTHTHTQWCTASVHVNFDILHLVNFTYINFHCINFYPMNFHI